MNHRELISSSIKKQRFSFMALPHELQDQLMEELESNRLSCAGASVLLRGKGYKISHAAIAGYMHAVRRARRTYAKSPGPIKQQGEQEGRTDPY